MDLKIAALQSCAPSREDAEEVAKRARYLLLDTVGAAIAGRDAAATRQTRVIFPARRAWSSTEASLVLGVAAQALDLDETNLRARCHIGASIVPAIISIAAERSVSGAQLLATIIEAYEFEARLGEAVAPGHGARGWHPSATIGAFGACLAASRLLALNKNQMRHALGIAGTQAAGVKAVFGGTAKAFNLGRAAQAGVTAAKLAAAGMTAPQDPFASSTSFFASAGATEFVESGGRPALLDNHFKFLPFCIETHAAALATSRLAGGKDRFERVEIDLAPSARAMVDRPNPVDMDQARFSVQYVVARGLRTPAPTVSPEAFDCELLTRAPAITIREDASLGHLAARATGFAGGPPVEHRADLGASGDFDPEALERKFDCLAEPALQDGTERMRRRILAADREADVSRLARMLVTCICRGE